MRLEEGQEEEILRSFRWMHYSLCKLAEERNSIILPQLAFETLSTAKVKPPRHSFSYSS
jgi:hypothetical protein